MNALKLTASRFLAMSVIVAVLLQPGTGYTQLTTGASLTVLRGTAAVLKADGTPFSPAPSGMTVEVNDQVATLAGSGALVTFFDGSEIELGSDAAIIIREMARQGSAVNIRIESIVGSTVHRVVQFADPASFYGIEAASTVAVVRGTEFGHRRDPAGDVSVAVADGTVDFPNPGQPLGPGEKRWVTPSGAVQSGKFRLGESLFNVVAEDVASGGADGPDDDDEDKKERERERNNRDK